MSWYSKVAWTEGLFLRPHHFQQNDRYHEHLLEARARHATPYPWGFSYLEIDRDLAQQSKFALRRAAGVMPDGTPFDIPADSPLPPPITVPDTASSQIAWLSMPVAAANTREIDDRESESAARFVMSAETFVDSSSALRIEEEIDIAFPRLGYELRKTAKPGYIGLGVTRIRSWTAGSTGWSAGSTTSSKSWRAMPRTRPPEADCKASTISCCNSSIVISRS